MGPNGVFKYIWYLDLFGVVYFLEDLAPPCTTHNCFSHASFCTLTILRYFFINFTALHIIQGT